MKNKFLKKCLEIAVIVIGNAILAFGICAFITPHGIIVGGASGLGLIVKQITGIPLSLVVYVINIIMFIASAYGNRTLMDAGSDIPELTLSYECSRLKANIHNAMEKDSLSRNEIVRLFKRYNDLAAKAEKSINKNIPECIFMKALPPYLAYLTCHWLHYIIHDCIPSPMPAYRLLFPR